VKQNIPVNLIWKASSMYEFGVTRYFNNGWHGSTGYVFNQNSVPDGYYIPLAADINRDFSSVDVGFQSKTFNFDIAPQFGYAPKQTVRRSAPSSTPEKFAGKMPMAGTASPTRPSSRRWG
jgi:long-subunit fatty acid transport protein